MNRAFTQNRKEAFHHFFLQDRFARTSGMVLDDVGYGWAQVSMLAQERHLNAADQVMGGALFTLCDFALAVASNSYGVLAVGTHMDIHLLKPPGLGRLIARAEEISRGKKVAVYEVSLEDERHRLCCKMTGSVILYPDRELFAGAIFADEKA